MVRRKTNEEFVKEVYKLVGEEYTLLEEYVNNCTKILCRHNDCGYEWSVLPYSILRGSRCLRCFGNVKKTNEEFVKEICELVGDKYKIEGCLYGQSFNGSVRRRF